MFSDKAIMEGFMRERMMKRILQYYKDMTTVIVGIGQKRGGFSFGYLVLVVCDSDGGFSVYAPVFMSMYPTR